MNTALVRSSDTDGPATHTTILGGSGFQERTRLTKDKLQGRSHEESSKNETHLGRDGDSSFQQTKMASECGPMRPHGRGMKQGQSQ